MEDVKVDKEQLLKTLRKNRKKHRGIYEKALEAYRVAAIEAFEKRLDDAKNGREIVTFVNLPQPEDHTADFDTAIEMLEWDKGKSVILSQRDFQRFVQNKWEWRASFAANTESYVAG
jgi:hypothetical protein